MPLGGREGLEAPFAGKRKREEKPDDWNITVVCSWRPRVGVVVVAAAGVGEGGGGGGVGGVVHCCRRFSIVDISVFFLHYFCPELPRGKQRPPSAGSIARSAPHRG